MTQVLPITPLQNARTLPMASIADRFGRRIEYPRVSLTDRRSLRCVYCMPAEGVPYDNLDNVLTLTRSSA